MREERKWVENGKRKSDDKPKGYVHRLDQVATSFFITNFPDDVKAADLWPKFARFGRVGEVYIPDKVDKQGRRFGFVKYRDIRDAREQLDLISNIWFGSFKIRVNLSRFEKGKPSREKKVGHGVDGVAVPGLMNSAVKEAVARRSFKDAVNDRPVVRSSGIDPEVYGDGGKGGSEVVWEVEVDDEALIKLKGSFVGLLSEYKDYQLIQRNFVMDGYSNLVVTPLGPLHVLLSSATEDEVKGIVGAVGWWSSWFERFEEWSPNWSYNLRTTWLSCFGVPLHVWGQAIFRTVGFKFGSFIDTDLATKKMLRGDVARIKITTDSQSIIDSSISIMVLGKKYVIRVMEDVGGVLEENRVRFTGWEFL
jgi:hypothetical protein